MTLQIVCNLILGAMFVNSNHLQEFCEGFHMFCQNFHRICPDFHHIKTFGGCCSIPASYTVVQPVIILRFWKRPNESKSLRQLYELHKKLFSLGPVLINILLAKSFVNLGSWPNMLLHQQNGLVFISLLKNFTSECWSQISRKGFSSVWKNVQVYTRSWSVWCELYYLKFQSGQ